MKRWISFAAFAAALLAVGFPGPARAATISTLFNTGVNSSGTPLPDGTVGDPHYTLVGVPGGTTTILDRAAIGGSPIPPYIGDDSLSRWIGPNNAQNLTSPTGDYDYQTTFSLSGLDSTTAVINGGWSTDNVGVRILLNGVDTGISSTSFTQYSTGFASFAISSGFVSGTNTLDFIVNNGQISPDNNSPNPTALRVEMTGTATPLTTSTPEPGSLTVFGALGVLGFFGYGWRRRKEAV